MTTEPLHGVACIWKPGFSYKKAGVVCLDLHPTEDAQAGLFHRPDSPAQQRLMAGLDALNRRYGRETVHFASSGIRRAWTLRSEQKSPAYTTRWSEILSA